MRDVGTSTLLCIHLQKRLTCSVPSFPFLECTVCFLKLHFVQSIVIALCLRNDQAFLVFLSINICCAGRVCGKCCSDPSSSSIRVGIWAPPSLWGALVKRRRAEVGRWKEFYCFASLQGIARQPGGPGRKKDSRQLSTLFLGASEVSAPPPSPPQHRQSPSVAAH